MIRVIMIGNSSKVKGGITTVINQFKKNNWIEDNINIKYISSYSNKNSLSRFLTFIFSIFKLLFLLITNKVDIVHVHMSYKGSFTRAYIIQKISKIFKCKYVSHMHGSEFEKWFLDCNYNKQNKIKKYLRKCDDVIVLGESWREKILNIENDTKVVVIPNSIETQKKYAHWNKETNFLFMGVLIKRKGLNDLIQVVNRMKKKYKFKIFIAGTGNEEENLKKLVDVYHLNDFFYFFGWIDNETKQELFLKSQVLILPSYNEGLPMAILEGMSYGLPIVASNVGDIDSVVLNGVNGYLFEPGKLDEIEKSMIKIIGLNEKKWNKFSDESVAIIEKKYSFDNYMNKIVQLYRNLGGNL